MLAPELSSYLKWTVGLWYHLTHNEQERRVPPGYFSPNPSREWIHPPTSSSSKQASCWSEVERMLLWAFFFPSLLFVCICVTGWKAECDSQPAGAVDLGGLPSGNRSASCIDFYFHGWVIWVSALESQLGCHQGQLGRRGICFCLHQFQAVSRHRCVVLIGLLHLLLRSLLPFFPLWW